jgi:hypothetical protein
MQVLSDAVQDALGEQGKLADPPVPVPVPVLLVVAELPVPPVELPHPAAATLAIAPTLTTPRINFEKRIRSSS